MSAESPSMSVVRLPLVELNKMDQSSFISHVGWVYENSPWVAEGVEASSIRDDRKFARHDG